MATVRLIAGQFSADAMTEFSLIACFELYFLLGFSVSVSVYALGGSTGFDFLGGSTGSNLLNPLPVFIKFDDSMFLVMGLDR